MIMIKKKKKTNTKKKELKINKRTNIFVCLIGNFIQTIVFIAIDLIINNNIIENICPPIVFW